MTRTLPLLMLLACNGEPIEFGDCDVNDLAIGASQATFDGEAVTGDGALWVSAALGVLMNTGTMEGWSVDITNSLTTQGVRPQELVVDTALLPADVVLLPDDGFAAVLPAEGDQSYSTRNGPSSGMLRIQEVVVETVQGEDGLDRDIQVLGACFNFVGHSTFGDPIEVTDGRLRAVRAIE